MESAVLKEERTYWVGYSLVFSIISFTLLGKIYDLDKFLQRAIYKFKSLVFTLKEDTKKHKLKTKNKSLPKCPSLPGESGGESLHGRDYRLHNNRGSNPSIHRKLPNYAIRYLPTEWAALGYY